MNLFVSYNWLKEYVKLKQSPKEFAARLSLSGPSVERIHRQGEGLEKVVVGKILKVKPHPNADKLRVAETDIGGMIKDIVCGGSNLADGQLVAVALPATAGRPGAMVKWHGEGEPVEIKETKLRGVESYGMICGADEIGLLDLFPKKGEREIIDLTSTDAKPGTPLAKALGLDDVIFDVEVTSNRPDAMCMVGMAREAAAIFDTPLLWKEPVIPAKAGTQKPEKKALPLSVEVRAKKFCLRYQAVAMTGAKVGPSPLWLKRRLAAAGLNSINNLVDITNYVMLELGQPMHVFDHRKLRGGKIVVREAAEGEKIKALDGNVYQLKPGQLVIADAERPAAIAGIMGGADTGVTETTTDIVFEAATFDPVSVRRAARALNLHSASSLRFEKGLSTEMTGTALARAVQLAREIAGATVASAVIDKRAAPYKKLVFPFRPARAAELIGVEIPVKEMKRILTALGFRISGTGAKWNVTVPYWRDHDIEGERDLIEEVARVHGYENLPSAIPEGPLPLPEPEAALSAEDRVKRLLKAWGLTEVIAYSFISGKLADAAGFPKETLLRISNPLTEDYEYMRPSLLPGILTIIRENQEEVPAGGLFELSNVYLKRAGDLPEEQPRLAIALWSSAANGSLFLKLKGLAEALAAELGIVVSAVRVTDRALLGGAWHPGRCAELKAEGETLARLSELHPAYCAKFGIDRRVAYLELMFVRALKHGSDAKRYVPIPVFPPAKRDLAFVLERHHEHAVVFDAIRKADPLVARVELFDVFEDAKLGAGKKSMAYHLEFAAPDRTLTAAEADAAADRVRAILKKEFEAEIRV